MNEETLYMNRSDNNDELPTNIDHQGNVKRDRVRNENRPMYKKVFVERNSMLTDLYENKHISTIYHIFVAFALYLILLNVLYEWRDKRAISFGFADMAQKFNNIEIGILCWMIIKSLTVLTHPVFEIWAHIHRRTTCTKFFGTCFILIFCIYFIVLHSIAVYFCLEYDLSVITSFALLLEALRLTMKSYAYIRSNAERVISIQTDFAPPTLSHYLYFLWCPTLLYRDSYPRTSKRSWKRVFKYLLEFLLNVYVLSLANTNFIQPLFIDYGKSETTLLNIIIRLIETTVIVTPLFYFNAFYILQHSWMNIFAEVLRFGERVFYKDWWTAKSIKEYYRRWNVMVHEWLYEYLYTDLYNHVTRKSLTAAALLTVIVSALFHEYVLFVSLRFFLPVLPLTYLTFGILYMFIKINNWAANTFVWFNFIIGISLATTIYSMEYYARINCPIDRLSNETMSFMPMILQYENKLIKRVIEQRSLISSIKIIGVPKQDNEITTNVVTTPIKNGLELPLEPENIYDCFRVKTFEIPSMSTEDEKIVVALPININLPNDDGTDQIPNVKRAMYKKVFVERNSLLTDLYQNSKHINALYNMFLAAVILIVLINLLYEWRDNRVISFGFVDLAQNFYGIEIGMLGWLVIMSLTVLSYPVFGLWMRIHRRATCTKLIGTCFIIIYLANVFGLHMISTYVCLKYDLAPVTCLALSLETLRLTMKSYAYIRSNAKLVMTSQNEFVSASFTHFMYFLWCPTMIYRDSYPRTNKRSWKRVFKYLLEFLLNLYGSSLVSKHFVQKSFVNYGKSDVTVVGIIISWIEITAFVSPLFYFNAFYAMQHSWMNMFAELLRFGDRAFYKDWWTAKSMKEFYRRWSLLVHEWLYEYIYTDLYIHITRKSFTAASLVTVVISALIHEYVIVISLRFFVPALLLLYLSLGILYLFIKLGNLVGNVFVWFNLMIGISLLHLIYLMEYYARINCASDRSLINDTMSYYYTPMILECNNILLQ